MTKIFIEQRFLDELKSIFKTVAPASEILAYGSRVDGTAHEGSDLDLALVGEGDLAKLKSALEESNIPFLIDVVKFEDVPESFQKQILKNYVVIYKGCVK